MSISRNVGAVSSYFSRFRSGKRYLRFKRRTSRILLSVPLVGKPLFKIADLDKVVARITSKPVRVVATHGHIDHVGNIRFSLNSICIQPIR